MLTANHHCRRKARALCYNKRLQVVAGLGRQCDTGVAMLLAVGGPVARPGRPNKPVWTLVEGRPTAPHGPYLHWRCAVTLSTAWW